MVRKNKDYVGQKFGKWTILKRDLTKKRPYKVIARCECGAENSIYIENLKRGLSTQCTICQSLSNSSNKSNDLINKKFEHIKVLSLEKHEGKVKAKVKCDCGNIAWLSPFSIRNQTYISCGKCNLGYRENERRRKNAKHYCNKIGEKFGYLTIISYEENIFTCKCDCGNEIKAKIYHLTTQYPSCGCYWKNKRIERAKKLIGLTRGRLRIIEFLGMKGPPKKTRAHYLLRCKCGNLIEKEVGQINSVFSCGCLQKDSVLKGEDNPNAILKNIEVASLRELFKSGLYNRKEISGMFDISLQCVCSILKNKIYKDI
jgi:hypothetical protein